MAHQSDQETTQNPTDMAPLHLADHGWFYAGGEYTGGGPMTGAMYVEFFIPENQTKPNRIRS